MVRTAVTRPSSRRRTRRVATLARGEETRNNIIDAAIDTFGDLGYAASKTREIARRAKVHHPVIAYYFGGKLALWRECARVVQQDGITQFREFCIRAASLEPAERFCELVRLLVTRAARYRPNAYSFMLRYALDHEHAELGNSRAGILASAHDVWLGELVNAQRAGILPADIDPMLLQYMLIGMTSRLYLEPAAVKMRAGIDVSDEGIMNSYIDGIIKTILKNPPTSASKRGGLRAVKLRGTT